MEARSRMSRGLPILVRVLVLAILTGTVSLSGCGGSEGVEDGTIVGRVFGNASGGSTTPTPLTGVTVVAERTTDLPQVVRTTTTDANGDFVLPNMPAGQYRLGFSRRGYQTIDSAQGATVNRTTIDSIVRIFVEPNGTSVAPDITLAKLPDEGDSTIVITLVDAISGEPVTNATLSIGAATTSNGGANGVYTLSVPVRASSGGDGAGELPPTRVLLVSADGYDSGSINPPLVRPIANETVTLTVQIVPNQARITGFIRISQFETLYSRSFITVTVDNVPVVFSNTDSGINGGSVVNDNGFFSIVVPASNSVLTRQFNLNFSARNLQPTVVSNVVAPLSFGTRQLTSPVVMQPVTVDLVGTVVDSAGGAPNQLSLSGIPDIVTVLETGQVANIINGTYTIPDVPATAQGTGPLQLTLIASFFNPTIAGPGGFPGVQEQATRTISPTSDGSPNPSFTVPILRP